MAIARIGIVDNKKKTTPAKTIGEATKEIAAKKKKKKKQTTVTVVPKITPIVSTEQTVGNSGLTRAEYDARAKREFEERQRRKAEAAGEEKVVLADTTLVNNAPKNVQQVESVESIINRMREERRRESQAAKEAEIAQGTTLLEGSLAGTQAQFDRQAESLDPRFGALKGSAVAGTRVAQNRLAGFSPFSGQQTGRTLRQAQGLETSLQGRQSGIDAARTEEEQGIAFGRQQAQDQFSTGLTALTQGATAADIARNVQANEAANAALLDEARFSRDQLLASEAQAVQDQISGDATTLDLAFTKWDAGIPLNEAEAIALGVQTGSTKPRTVSSGGGGTSGLSDSALATNARFKINNGQPLTAEEARVFGVSEGYVDPNFQASSTDGSPNDDAVNADLQGYIQQKGGNTRQSVIEWMINNDGRYSIEQGYAIMDAYGLEPIDLQRRVNINPSVGQ